MKGMDSTQLTPEQRKLATLIAEGCTSRQIGVELGMIAPRVLEQQMRELFEILGGPPPAASAARIP